MKDEKVISYISKQDGEEGHWAWCGPTTVWMDGSVVSPVRAVLRATSDKRGRLGLVPVSTCGDPSCINPAHLTMVTRREFGKRHRENLLAPYAKGGFRKRAGDENSF